MARIYAAREKMSPTGQGLGRFDMTVGSDEEKWIHAIGYCVGIFEKVWPETPPVELARVFSNCGQDYQAERAKTLPLAAKFHGDGHATKEEANACWQGYRLDHEVTEVEQEDRQQRCLLCQAWTTHLVVVGVSFPKELTICAACLHDAADRRAVIARALDLHEHR